MPSENGRCLRIPAEGPVAVKQSVRPATVNVAAGVVRVRIPCSRTGRVAPGARASMRAYKAERQGDRADQDEAHGPGRIQIEPTPRHEFQAEIAVDQPRA